MTETAHNLLTEPLIETDIGWLSLPGVLAAMARGEITDFSALRAHQRPAWHMFLVQLAVLAASRAGYSDLSTDESSWCDALRAMAAGYADDAPWCLIAPDTSPAFLQPPTPRDGKWTDVDTPDTLDMLITSRGHDLKTAVARRARPQDWIYALVSVQTMEGYSGPTWNGIARMNGGSSSRAMVTLAPALPDGKTLHPSLWWRRDAARLLRDRAESNGLALVWLMPWAGDAQLSVGQDLDPLFIEICRRIRLLERDGLLMARKAGSKVARIASVNGLTDDPWAPVSIEKPRSYTMGDGGAFTYRTLRDLTMSGKWTPSALARADGDEAGQTMLLVAEAFARGNSKTGGFKSRVVPMSKTVAKRILTTIATDQSAHLMDDIARIDKALRNGVALLAANGMRDGITKDHYARAATAREQLDQHADAMFFPVLWNMLEAGEDATRLARRAHFMCDLSDLARAIFREQRSAIPCKAVMRPRAEARAGAYLEHGLRDALTSSGLADHLPVNDRTDAQKETEDYAG